LSNIETSNCLIASLLFFPWLWTPLGWKLNWEYNFVSKTRLNLDEGNSDLLCVCHPAWRIAARVAEERSEIGNYHILNTSCFRVEMII
jgi:hypothetical protein